MLVNLVNNGIKFTELGHVLIQLECTEEAASAPTGEEVSPEDEPAAVRRCRVAFSVTDTGIGIGPEVAARLFRPFVQADVSTTRKYGGTGLGLAISQQLIAMMDGVIRLESAVGEGSVFSFELVLDTVQARTGGPPVQNLAGLHVLIVEDNRINRAILHEHVTSWGMRDGRAADGVEGLEMLRAAAARGEPYDVALVDLKMPRMDGMELTRRIRQDPALDGVSLVMLTSLTSQGEMAAARRAGISAYVTKPIRQTELFQTVAGVIGRRSLAGQPQTPVADGNAIGFRAHVLVAEDNLVNQELALAMLLQIGCTADLVDNGRKAVEALRATAYDAVLMDCQMPEMDGFEATSLVRSGAAGLDRAGVPIIALTANAMRGDRERCLAAGMTDYVPKPLTRRDLFASLTRCVGNSAPQVSDVIGASDAVDPEGTGGSDVTTVRQLNPRALAQIRELDPGGALLARVGQLFLDSAPGLAASLTQAAARGDAPSGGRAAHSLKSSSANLGADSLAGLCKRAEEDAKSGEIAEELATEIGRELEQVLSMVRNELCPQGQEA